MARQPKVDLGSILNPEKVQESPIPETDPEPQKRSYPSRAGKGPVQFFLNKAAHRQLKITCAETDRTHQDIMVEALNAWFQINDKPPIA